MLAITTSANSALGRQELDALLVRYDRHPEGSAKNRLAMQIDAVAHQKYATVSRLYWHTKETNYRARALYDKYNRHSGFLRYVVDNHDA